MEKELTYVIGALIIFVFVLIAGLAIKPEWSLAYKQGVLVTKREAFEHGYMTKDVSEKDEVIYKWKENK